ncbi:hypothetical protein FJT64_009175 [Amphibalanus amphitrite]|uniref:C3H1-type domain-containing protein n=1 Tax=Amphibalanus amphitrite TaxID=1232801 RepID=A0A6A4VU48_AMPAM|nr:hypothetical protein FJT64_009175 [Amphibalanus amphitrite]
MKPISEVNVVTETPEPAAERLPLPSFSSQLSGASVFSNPYRQEEDARRAVLEKHVKLTTAPTELRHINGKQVCWNYRKGRCRFGRGCKFAHDSDLQRDGAEEESSDAPPPAAEPGRPAAPPPPAADGQQARRKRPGLGDTLAPGKKVMKMYTNTRKGPLV